MASLVERATFVACREHGEHGAAIAALAAAHATASPSLQRADRRETRLQLDLDAVTAQLLAAADGGLGGREFRGEVRRPEQPPETVLEASMAREGRARLRFRDAPRRRWRSLP